MKDKIRFERRFQEAAFHNPLMDNELDTQKLEIRLDPLTGCKSVFNPRLEGKAAVLFGITDRELIERLARESEPRCFLCGERWKEMTPMYPEDRVPGGRIEVGEAVIFPNLFPLSPVHAVIRVGENHSLFLRDFEMIRILEAFRAALELLRAITRSGTDAAYFTINGNYLGPAGASIAHPHFQVLGGDIPFTWLDVLLERSREYREKQGSCYWSDLLEAEKEAKERFVFETGPVSWIASFSPQGTNEILGILPGTRNFLEINEADLEGLAEGLSRVLKGYDSMGLSTFNFSIYSGPLNNEDDAFRCFLRVISRQNVYENYRTDDYFLQKLLRNELIIKAPEALASLLRE